MAKNLVEPQGVNTGEPDPAAAPGKSAADTESGGDLSAAPDRRQGLIGYPEAKPDQTDEPDQTESPRPEDGSSGQDEGLMD